MKFLCAADAASEACCLCSRQTARQLARVSKRADEDWQGMWEALKKKKSQNRACLRWLLRYSASALVHCGNHVVRRQAFRCCAMGALVLARTHVYTVYCVAGQPSAHVQSPRASLGLELHESYIIDSCHTLIHRGPLNPAAQKEQPQHDEHMCVCFCVREIEGYSASC